MSDQRQSPPTATKAKISDLLGTIPIVVGVIVAIAIGTIFGKEATKKSPTRANNVPPLRNDEPTTWSTRSLGDISIEAPFHFGPGPDIRERIPANIREAMEYYEIFDSGESTNPRVTVSRIAYKPGFPASLDGAMNGAMNGAMRPLAKASGDANPQFSSTTATIDGFPARRASYACRTKDTPIRLDAVFIKSGQKLWHVQVMVIGDSHHYDSQRFLNTIHINITR